MKIIVGLGNPGEKFKNTRHNVGFMVVDKLFQKSIRQLADKDQNDKAKFKYDKKLQSEILELDNDILLVKPQTFMNTSGAAVKKIVQANLPAQAGNSTVKQFNNLYIVHDDLDIKLGNYKIQFGKGPKVHQGIKSVEQHLRSGDFWRVRVGVQGEHYQKIKSSGQSMAEGYVLKPFPPAEEKELRQVTEMITNDLVTRT